MGVTNFDDIELDDGKIKLNGSFGSSGQVVQSAGSGATAVWANAGSLLTAGNGISISSNTVSVNASGALTFSSSVLIARNATSAQSGIVSTSSQSFGGTKSFAAIQATSASVSGAISGSAVSAVSVSASGPVSGSAASFVSASVSGPVTGSNATFQGLTANSSVIGLTQISSAQIKVGGFVQPGEWNNLGLTLSSGTLSLTGSDGSALSSSNLGVVAFDSTTAGAVKFGAYSAPLTITDSTEFINIKLGTTASTAWSASMPLFLYAISGTSQNQIGLSRNPVYKSTPSSAEIAFKTGGAPGSDDEEPVLVWSTASSAISNYANRPCVLIGGVTATKDGGDDWTFDAISTSLAQGIRKDPHDAQLFDMPTGQNGAATSSHLSVAAGGVPAWASPENIIYKYGVTVSGKYSPYFTTRSAGNVTNGTAAVSLEFALPANPSSNLYPSASAFAEALPIGSYSVNAAANGDGVLFGDIESEQALIVLRDSALTTIQGNDFTATSDDLVIGFEYKAF